MIIFLKILLAFFTGLVLFLSIALWAYMHHEAGTLYPIDDSEDLLYWNVRYYETTKIKEK